MLGQILSLIEKFIGPALGIIGTVIGTILGFALNERATRQREERVEKRQADSARTLLRPEIDRNWTTLLSFAYQVNLPRKGTKEEDLARAYHLVELHQPLWNRTVWETQTSLLPVALDAERIKQVHDFYAQLGNLTRICSALLALASEAHEDMRIGRIGGAPQNYFHHFTYRDRAVNLSIKFLQVANGLKASRKPLYSRQEEQQHRKWLRRLFSRMIG